MIWCGFDFPDTGKEEARGFAFQWREILKSCDMGALV
jgi:hypothetical protein